jgi:tetratricopeptide (TPR) repeat protein
MSGKNEIILRFQRVDTDAEFDAPIPVTVHYDSTDTEAIQFVNPITDKNLSELRWYLESYWQWPSDIDDDRARAIEGNLPKWGKALMEGIIQKSADAMRLFGRFSEAGGERMLTIDTTEPRILRLPWELLRDEGGYLFSEGISVRRRMHKVKPQHIQPFDLPVRILMVTCRPDGAGFIDPRSIATPLLDALDALPEQFEVEFLRPPTLKALDERLRDESLPRVHIVHFDGHGVYDKGVGLGFLLFEDENHQKHLVDAEQLGTLLNKSGIPLMVLNACQSAQSDDRNPFASVASRLIESGVGGVVAMNYSVLVETAKHFTCEFYGALARGQSANAAMDSARRDLFRDTKKFTIQRPHSEEEIIIHLQDWFLPALYQQAEELIPFAPLSPATALSSQGKGAGGIGVSRGKFPPAPLHGFHGRARELLDLERAFATRNIIVLHGFGGQGKTSLATQAAEWFTRTHLFERAAFISFETGASLDFVINELGNALVEDNFQIHQGDKVEAIAQSLREKPALIVFDNFESALPNGNAPMPDLQLLLDAAAKWFVPNLQPPISNSCLLVTTRNTDIPHPSFTPSKTCLHKELTGLAASDALELAASILEAYSLPRPPRVPLENLLTFLKGHPLSLQLALPQLRDYSAEQLVEQYQSILPQMKKGEAKERNESLEVSLRFSLDRLGADALNWLTRLWIFEGGAMEHVLLAITEIPEETWNSLKPQLTSTALIRVEEVSGVNVPFIHFHPTLAPYLKAINDNSTSESQISNIEERYWNIYCRFASQLYQDDTQHPIQARSIVLRELPNLKRALQRTLAAGAFDEAVTFADRINRFLDVFGRWRERDEVAALVERAVNSDQSSVGSGKINKRDYLMESGRGQRLLQQGRAADAEKVFRALLSRLEGEAEYDTRYDQTLILRNIGLSLRSQGHPSQAVDFYRRRIALAEEMEQTENVKQLIGTTYTDLADTFRDMGQYDNARKEYEAALEIDRELGDERGQGVDLGQLGTLAMLQGDLNEARKRYLEALSLFQRMGEDKFVAIALKQLGMLEEEDQKWDKAEEYYKTAMPIQENIGDFPEMAKTCNQLAIVAKNAGRPQEAERWYLRAIELKEKYSTPSDLASSLSNLANLYLSQNRLDEAEEYARRALAIDETLDPAAAKIWKNYSFFAELAEKRGHKDEAREWRRKEQESFAAFAGSDNEIKQWLPVIADVVSACNGNEEAIKKLEPFLQKMEQTNDWRNLIAVIRRIMNGERDGNIVEGLDRTDALIVTRILQALSGESNPLPPASQSPSPDAGEGQGEGGVTLPQFLELVERAAGGDKELGGQLFTALQQMARADDPGISALGNVLLRVLIGERSPDLSGLPDEVASMVRGMLGRIKNK